MKTFEFHSFRVGIQLQTVELEGWNNTGCTQYMQFSSNPGDFLQSEESQRVFWDTLANGAVKRALIRDLSIREYVSKLKHTPLTRWWWMRGPFREEDMVFQLDWMKSHGLGGAEVAFFLHDGTTEDNECPAWLSPEFTNCLSLCKQLATSRGLVLDYTFGSCWPFGGPGVTQDTCMQSVRGITYSNVHHAWYPRDDCLVLNHLNSDACRLYCETLLNNTFGRREVCGDVNEGRDGSAFFCDSLELQTRYGFLWDSKMTSEYEQVYKMPFEIDDECVDNIVRYRKLIAEVMFREFYTVFSDCVPTYTRVQCHGSPTDLLRTYAVAHVPESEAILFPIKFSRIAASAAALSGKTMVSCETFTCLYGFPQGSSLFNCIEAYHKEDVKDMKMLFDVLAAQGVNRIVWHGMPYNGEETHDEFYASVHLSPGCVFEPKLLSLNQYMERVCDLLRQGSPYASIGQLLPNESVWCDPKPMEEKRRTPGAVYNYEHRYTEFDAILTNDGYHPTWISTEFLTNATVLANGRIFVSNGSVELDCLVIGKNVTYLGADSKAVLQRLCVLGANIVMNCAESVFESPVSGLASLPCPLVQGIGNSSFHCRVLKDQQVSLYFFSHPACDTIRFPMKLNQHLEQTTVTWLNIQFNNPFTPQHPEWIQVPEMTFVPDHALFIEIDWKTKQLKMNSLSLL